MAKEKKTTKTTATAKGKTAAKPAAKATKPAAKSAKPAAAKEEKPTAKAYHVAKREDGLWTVKLAKGEKVIKTFKTKVEAVEYTEAMSKNQGATMRVHASKGANKGKIQKS